MPRRPKRGRNETLQGKPATYDLIAKANGVKTVDEVRAEALEEEEKAKTVAVLTSPDASAKKLKQAQLRADKAVPGYMNAKQRKSLLKLTEKLKAMSDTNQLGD
jgi:hypothetical protein